MKILSADCAAGQKAGLSFPSGLLFDPRQQRMIVCDLKKGRVAGLPREEGDRLGPARRIGRREELSAPLAVTRRGGQFVVADAELHGLYQASGGHWERISIRGRPDISLPAGITADEAGNLYVIDFYSDQVLCITPDGQQQILQRFSCKRPYGICYHGGALFLADTGNSRLRRYDLITGQAQTLAGGISPISVTADADGDLYFSENRKLYFLHTETGETECIIDSERWKRTGLNRLTHIGALCSAGPNTLFFTDTTKNSIYRLVVQK